MSINVTTLVGRLVKDIELKYTSNGTAVASFTLAVNRNFTDKSGNQEADFIQCVIWRKSAELMANMAHKGTLVGIVGRIQTRNYDNQQGQRVYVTEVVADSFQLLEPKRDGGMNQTDAQTNNTAGNWVPQSNNQNQTRDISDDLPF